MRNKSIRAVPRQAISLLCVGLMVQALLVAGGCGAPTNFSPEADGTIRIPLAGDDPISLALEGTAFADPTTLEIDLAAGLFRIRFRDPQLRLEGRFDGSGLTVVGDKRNQDAGGALTITELVFANGDAAATFELDLSKRITRIGTSAGAEWVSPRGQSEEPAGLLGRSYRVAGNHADSAGYAAANAGLFEYAAMCDDEWREDPNPVVVASQQEAQAAFFIPGRVALNFVTRWVLSVTLGITMVDVVIAVLGQITEFLSGIAPCVAEGGVCDEDHPCCTGLTCENGVCLVLSGSDGIVNSNGGVFQGAGGVSVTIPPGAVDQETPISLEAVSADDLGIDVPPGYEFIGAAALDIGEVTLNQGARIAVPAPGGVLDDAEIYVAQVVDHAGTMKYRMVESAVVEGETVVSDEFALLAGIVESGTYCFLWPQTALGWVSGQMTLDGEAVPQAVATISGNFFRDVADQDGNYALPTWEGNFVVVAFDSLTGASGEQASYLPSEDNSVTLNIALAVIDLAVNSALENGSFETGDLSGWTLEGDGSVVEGLGPIQPQDGSFMAMIINSDDAIEGTMSGLRQAFTVPAGATTLVLWYNLVSEEYPEYVEAEYNDVFLATLQTPNGSVEIAFEEVSSAAFEPVEGVDFPSGDVTVGQTGWLEATVDITLYAGTDDIVTLTIHDVGDALFDTVVLIDGIALTGGS